MSLKEKVALVAGGSVGIGQAVALLLAQNKTKVVIADIDANAGRKTLARIQKADGQAAFVEADLSRSEGVDTAVRFVLETFGRIDVLFNSVGIYARAKLADTEEDLWDRIMRINVKSAFLLCKAVIPAMQAAGGGSIILSSSSVGWHATAPNIAAYATSKFAITGLTKAAACDYLQDNIRVNCICPGPTDTPMIRGGRTSEELTAFISGLPIQRLADPQEVAQVVVFLASDESAYVTGVAFPVDGGQTAWL